MTDEELIAWMRKVMGDECLAAARLEALRAERDEALVVLRERYLGDNLSEMATAAMTEIRALAEHVNRLRGVCNADADLLRFMRVIDHEPYVSRGQMSDMLDFAQGQKARAEKAEAENARLREALEPFAAYGKLLLGQRVSSEGVVVELFDTALTVGDFRRAALAPVEAKGGDDGR